MIIRDRQVVATTGDPPLTTAVAKAHLNVVHDEDNALIAALASAAVAEFEAVTGMKLRSETREATFDRFPGSSAGCLTLPNRPVTSVSSVKYFDTANVEQTLVADTDYQVTLGFQAKVLVGPDKAWPSVKAGKAEPVAVRYVVGGTVPDDVLGALKLMVGERYENRGDSVKAKDVPPAARRVMELHSTSTPG